MKRLIFFAIFAIASIQFTIAKEAADSLTHIVIGHKCLFGGQISERFEFNYERNKLYRLTIHANYLHIKGEKFRTEIKTTKAQWKELNELICEYQPKTKTKKLNNEYDYFITYLKDGYVINEFQYNNENIPKLLLDILQKIKIIAIYN